MQKDDTETIMQWREIKLYYIHVKGCINYDCPIKPYFIMNQIFILLQK